MRSVGSRGDEPAEEPRVLRVSRDDLVSRPDAEAGDDDVAAVGGRGREREGIRGRAEKAREHCAKVVPERKELVEEGAARPALLDEPPRPVGDDLAGAPRQRAQRPGVQVGHALADGELVSDRVQVHATTASTGA